MSTEMLTCPQCGSPVPANALLCPKCGRPNVSTAFAGSYSTPLSQTPPSSSVLTTPPEAQPPEEQRSQEQPIDGATAPTNSAFVLEPPSMPEPAQAPQAIPDPPRPTATPEWAPLSEAQSPSPSPFAASELPASLQPGPVYASPDSSPEALDQALSSLPTITPSTRVMTVSDTPVPVNLPPYPDQAQHTHQLRHVQYGQQDQPPEQDYDVKPTQPSSWVAWTGDPNTAFLLELLGFIGFLGLGHLSTGHIKRGIALLAAWWWCLLMFVPRLGSSPCLIPLLLAVPAASGIWIWYEMGGNKRR